MEQKMKNRMETVVSQGFIGWILETLHCRSYLMLWELGFYGMGHA